MTYDHTHREKKGKSVIVDKYLDTRSTAHAWREKIRLGDECTDSATTNHEIKASRTNYSITETTKSRPSKTQDNLN